MPNNRANKGRKRKGKDIDQIHEDLVPEKAAKLLNQEVDYDLPGNGQHYCVECNRYFEDGKAIATHKKTKGNPQLYPLLPLILRLVHKYRLKQLKEKPYSQKEADAAGGLGVL
uniref:Zf-C2H2_jaz domain-containing protein n=1 Tax=Steinernema glaseri TaxID=37863 RepID=A0A1I8A1K4_9BILA